MHFSKFRDSSNYYDKMPYIEDNFGDILNGNTAVSALQEMSENFEARKERGELVDYVNSPHLLSEFYDGAQLFDKRISNFHALMISILNLPPSYRTKMGCGAFVIAVHTLKESSRAERTLTLRLFVEELRLLYAGFKVKIGETNYFIQARCTNHSWDTPALAANANAKVNNAKNPCIFCGGICGVYRQCLQHNYYMGHRALLPINHVLRWFGNSGKCCPEQYYKADGSSEAAQNVQQLFLAAKGNTEQGREFPRNKKVSYISGKSEGCNNDVKSLKEAMQLTKDTKPNLWYHEHFSFERTGFSQVLSYPHADLRKEINADHVTDRDYKIRAQSARRLEYGYKNLWLFHSVCKWDHLMWEAFHTITNCCDNILLILKGIRANGSTIRQLCKAERVHPSLWYPDNNGAPIWQLGENAMDYMDALMGATLFPYGYESKFGILNPFRQTGYLKGMQVIQFVTTFLPTFLHLTDLSREYKVFISMFAVDIADLLSVNLDADEVESLSERITETVCVKEGLFSDSEANIVWHQLTDLPGHIPKAGPIMSWWGPWGERILGELKR